MNVILQILTTDNAELLWHIAADVFDDEIIPAQLETFLADPRHLMILAVDNGTVVGMASAFEYVHPDKRPQLFINEVSVAPDYRMQGIGRRLVESLIVQAKDRSCNYAWLGTDADNVAGQACFGSVAGVKEPQPFLLYEWDL
jgi:aminoglycoside 6'-N-acetyltransferase I